MSDERRDYGPTGRVNRSFTLLVVVFALYRVVRRG
jgi:hypothetical protein